MLVAHIVAAILCVVAVIILIMAAMFYAGMQQLTVSHKWYFEHAETHLGKTGKSHFIVIRKVACTFESEMIIETHDKINSIIVIYFYCAWCISCALRGKYWHLCRGQHEAKEKN